MITSKNSINLNMLAEFIARLNNIDEHHVGYCGEKQEEILDSLTNNFSDIRIDDSFSVIYKEEKIIAALGADVSLEDKTAELWGPFINGENPEELSLAMWEDLSSKLSDKVHTFNGFYNSKNIHADKFMKMLGGVKRGNHLILKVVNKDFIHEADLQIKELSKERYDDFIKLHEDAFPETYYTGQEIIDKIDNHNKVFVIENGYSLSGYVYVEGNPKFKEGNIEFIAVSPTDRKKGIGTRLIKSSLAFLFDSLKIDEITICVDFGNSKAINLYKSAGFKEIYFLNHYILEK
ncbi:GNAT family N-acetyltransferase [Bacillus sp. V3-13]|uniref:GNAT family N-acetyltransferase n=1 Tax=Bacillus sp. V3-13 TaxID=2053728 RepID=UPI000C7745FE|nr:GNAT family N-acetyltransferase [Bacillus sp. V3-13]PLR75807.1 GNAT family N-acetyltransferase [Bacillus sp. V3-13]